MKNSVLILLVLLSCKSVNSQIFKKNEKNKITFYSSVDFRNCNINNKFHEYYGLKLGVRNKSLRFGAGFYLFQRSLITIINPKEFIKLPSHNNFSTRYHLFNIFTELIIHETPRWELIVPIDFGTGKFKQFDDQSASEDENQNTRSLYNGQLHSFAISTKANFRIIKWGGLTTSIGYNFAFSNSKVRNSEFSTMFYSVGFKLFFEEMAKLLKSKEYRKKYIWDYNFVKNYE